VLFNSFTFLVFAAAFFAIWPLTKNCRWRNLYIVIASYVFYGFWNSPFLVLLIVSTIVDYWAGRIIASRQSQKARNALLFASLAYNLSVLVWFKYANFFMDSTKGLLHLAGWDVTMPMIHVVLPVGISFYTFVTLSYTLDVWKGEIHPEKDFIKYAAFVAFWPHLVAGPILRATQLLPQLSKRRRMSWQLFYQGLFLVSFGYFMKVAVADNLAKYVERVYDKPFPITTGDAWLATYAYAIQIFGDFSGYSNIAIGLALWMGICIPQNFNAPYAAISFTDFWRRWHISLSTWFREYLFLPVAYASSRKVASLKISSRTQNLASFAIGTLFTMLLCGLWHGAAWHFVAWGGLHGLYLAVERFLGWDKGPPAGRAGSWRLLPRRLVVFQLVCVTWVLFRAKWGRGWVILKAMAGSGIPGAAGLYGPTAGASILLVLAVTLCIQHWFADKDLIGAAKAVRLTQRGYVLAEALLILASVVAMGGQGAFIYFQF